MTLITVGNLRDQFPFVIQTDVKDGQLKRSIFSAANRLKKWIGESFYEEVAGDLEPGEGEEEAPEPTERLLILQNAEGHLALHYALLGLNTNLRSMGLVKREQVEGNTVNEYFSPNDVENFSLQYLNRALEIAEPYMLSDGTPTVGFEVVDGEESG